MGPATLLDRAVVQAVEAVRAVGQAVGAVADEVAVNVHHGREEMLAHLDRWRRRGGPPVHVSVEEPEALGTAGGVAALAGWLDGRSALVVNADTVHDEDLRGFVSGWDGRSVRVLMTGQGSFGPRSGVVASIVPAADVAALDRSPSGLWEVLWRPALGTGHLAAVHASGEVIDCGTPADYLRANLWLSGGASVIGDGAVVLGSVERSVVWPGAVVHAGEHLVDAIRTHPARTVLVRP